MLECTSTSLANVTLADVQQFATKLANSRLAQSFQAKMLSAIKSLFSFAYKLGITAVNVGAALKSPSPKNALGERILPEVEVQQLMVSATNERDRFSFGDSTAWNGLTTQSSGNNLNLIQMENAAFTSL
ncbi:site-specific integrase [Coleofasciculus sp. FACHB-1120]|uniref:site-specific integrase n=1 Tax=Coleofasciculus sp. FACHB-1120 TaxID=2692783 RepID=UPI0016833AEC|nr:site-specific integrase [Coleofasciculus sp. FACHB-1120]MBD2742145.1 site-specific integrase [Coleofasciculus sp. FACHB-1120]